MKRIIILSVLLLSLVSEIFAQQFYGGFRGGVSASQVSGDRLSGFNKAGLSGGMYAGLVLSQNLTLDAGMIFIQKGSRKNARPERGDYSTYLLRLNYIEVPLILTFTQNKTIEFEGGLSFGRLLKTTGVEFDENGILPGTQAFNPIEISGNLGLNYKFSDTFKLNFRLNNSIFRVRKHVSGASYWLNTGQFNTVILLGVVLNFSK